MRHGLGHAFKTTTSIFASEQSRLPAWWRLIGYIGAVSPFLLLLVLAWLRPDFNRTEIPAWQPVLALAEASSKQGNLYEARHLYSQVERIAAWRREWEGLVAAACGIKKLDGARGPYSRASQVLLRGLIAAQNRKSRQGVATVAKAFDSMGEHKAAQMARALSRSDWPGETAPSLESVLAGCGASP